MPQAEPFHTQTEKGCNCLLCLLTNPEYSNSQPPMMPNNPTPAYYAGGSGSFFADGAGGSGSFFADGAGGSGSFFADGAGGSGSFFADGVGGAGYFFPDGAGGPPPPVWDETTSSAVQLIGALHNPATRERALAILGKSKIRERLAPLLWNTPGTVAILLQELTSVYRALDDTLTERQSTQVCHTLALFQGLATHPETKQSFLNANIPFYLYPFLDSKRTEKPNEFVRLTSLGVIGALLKVDDPTTTKYLLESQVFPSCLRCMEIGSNLLSKTVATFIVYRLIVSDYGLKYCCTIADRFYAVNNQLRKMIEVLADKEFVRHSGIDNARRLLKHIIWCYHRLSENPRARCGLKVSLPARLSDTAFMSILQEDAAALLCLQSLFENIAKGGVAAPPSPSIENRIVKLGRR